MKKTINVILLLLTFSSLAQAFEIPENPDRRVSAALLIGRRSLDLTYEYAGWRYLYGLWPFRDTAKQNGTRETTSIGANIRIPWTPNITVDFSYIHINSNVKLDEIPFKFYELKINEYGRDILFSLRYYF